MTASESTSAVLARVEHELNQLWEHTPGELARARACTMNLVVVTGSPSVTERYTPVVDELTQSIPSRAIVATLDGHARAAGLTADVSAVCAADQSTCSERVRLFASGSVSARMASAVDALLVPEVPTTLVWLGRVHVEDPVFRELATSAQRVVLDTEYTSLPSLLALARWVRTTERKLGVADLAWTRIAVWQEMCARFFDDPQMRPLAHRVEALRLVQVEPPGASKELGSEAALFLGWLATRLGWRLEPVAGEVRFQRSDGGSIDVELATMPRPPDVAPLAIASLTLRMSAGDVTATGTVGRDIDGDPAGILRFKLDVNLPCAGEQTVRLGANTAARVLERTLRRPLKDDIFDAAVAFTEHLDGL